MEYAPRHIRPYLYLGLFVISIDRPAKRKSLKEASRYTLLSIINFITNNACLYFLKINLQPLIKGDFFREILLLSFISYYNTVQKSQSFLLLSFLNNQKNKLFYYVYNISRVDNRVQMEDKKLKVRIHLEIGAKCFDPLQVSEFYHFVSMSS